MPMRVTAVLLAAILVQNGCEEENRPPESPPPSRASVPKIEPDLNMAARVKADRTFAVPNLIFIMKDLPADPARMIVTLRSSEPGGDGSRLVFGSLERKQSLTDLATRSIDMTTSATLDLTGNGIFTVLRAYQPRFASLKIDSITEQEVKGRVTGAFYMFETALPTKSPKEISLEMSFRARLVKLTNS